MLTSYGILVQKKNEFKDGPTPIESCTKIILASRLKLKITL